MDLSRYAQSQGRGLRTSLTLDTGTHSNLLRAAQFVETVEMRQGRCIGSPEEVAWHKGYIDDESLDRLIAPFSGSEYGEFLSGLLVRG